MTGFNKRVFEMLGRVVVFHTTYPQFFGKDSLAGHLIAQIGAAVQKLSANATSQTAGKRAVKASSGDRALARKVLKAQLESFSRTARGLRLGQFWMPRDRGDIALVSVGKTWAQQAEPLKQMFIDSHMPADFIEKLNDAVRNLERAIHDQTFSKGTRLAATAAMEQTRNEALSALQSLDPVMENLLRDDSPVLAVWQSARHVERYSSSRAADTADPPAPQVPPQTPTSAAAA